MLHGDRDPLVPVENVDWLKNQLALVGKSNLFASIVLPGVNHFIPWEHPDEVAKAIGKVNDMAAGR
jgi:pimeloyl-ACP methyl ester carboxylesterase